MKFNSRPKFDHLGCAVVTLAALCTILVSGWALYLLVELHAMGL